jgi:hypothetical protein
MHQATRGDLLQALRSTGEAVDVYRRYVAAMPLVRPLLHAVLGLQAKLLDSLGHEFEAEEVRRWLRKNSLPSTSCGENEDEGITTRLPSS